MKFIALLLCFFGSVLAQEREGNFNIRFEPTAVLQTGAPVPFKIDVKDDLHKPLTDAKVTLQIEMTDHSNSKVFPAPAINPGIYIAKPLFPASGEWSVSVEVRRNDQMSARTIVFNVRD